eukprot:scaffold13355_cov56-Isochrysis_galbana.AAC.1
MGARSVAASTPWRSAATPVLVHTKRGLGVGRGNVAASREFTAWRGLRTWRLLGSSQRGGLPGVHSVAGCREFTAWRVVGSSQRGGFSGEFTAGKAHHFLGCGRPHPVCRCPAGWGAARVGDAGGRQISQPRCPRDTAL